MSGAKQFERIEPATRAAWRSWLCQHHRQGDSVWLVNWKKTSGKQAFTMDEAVEEALCFGWIDSLPRKLDEARTMLLISPRKPKSAWSAVNKARVERMIAAGLMTSAGLAKIEAAKADGSWDKLNSVDTLIAPTDLAHAFRRHEGSKAQWDAFPPSVRRGILEWLDAARTEVTREKRLEEIASLAARGERANQWRK